MFPTSRFYLLMVAVITVTALGFAVEGLFVVGRVLLGVLVLAVVADVLLLWFTGGVEAWRRLPERFSNGDANDVSIRVESRYAFPVSVEVIDEVPFVFQRRDVCFPITLPRMGDTTITYQLRPTERGLYDFGRVRLFAASPIGLLQRRVTCCEPQAVKVYPSFLMLRQYELLAMSNNLTEMGIKRIRRIGHNTDFEQIREYVTGDDYRTINWRATARRSHLMVNVYQEERSQPVYCVIDKGRMMQQAFAVTGDASGRPVAGETPVLPSAGETSALPVMTLLDYAINAALVLSFVAVNKHDRAGLVTFSSQMETFVAASRNGGHIHQLQEALYAEKAVFGETDYSALLIGLSKHVSHRSLIVLFTTFTSMPALRRQLTYLRQIASRHRLLVVFFEDEEIKESVAGSTPHTTEEYYQRVIAEKHLYDQRVIAQTLRQYGIQSLLTTPRLLSINVINKYLEIKATLA